MDYKSKYLKYHTKYLNLKKIAISQLGGNNLPPEMIMKIFEYMNDYEIIDFVSHRYVYIKYMIPIGKFKLKNIYSPTEIFGTTDTRKWKLISIFRFDFDSIIINDLNDLKILQTIVDDNTDSRESFNKTDIEKIKSIKFDMSFNEPLGNSLDHLSNLEEIQFEGGGYELALNDSFKELKKLKKLILSDNFNMPLGDSLDKLYNLESLTFGYSFNQSIDNSLDNLTKLKILNFGDSFTAPLRNYLDKLTQLEILNMGEFYQPELDNTLDKLVNLKKLTLSHVMLYPLNKSLDNLVNLEELTLSNMYNISLETYLYKLKNLRILNMGFYFNQELGNSFDKSYNIMEINFGEMFMKSLEPLIKLPKLIKITIYKNYPLVIPCKLKNLIFYNN